MVPPDDAIPVAQFHELCRPGHQLQACELRALDLVVHERGLYDPHGPFMLLCAWVVRREPCDLPEPHVVGERVHRMLANEPH